MRDAVSDRGTTRGPVKGGAVTSWLAYQTPHRDSGPLEGARYKDLRFRTAEKLEKNNQPYEVR